LLAIKKEYASFKPPIAERHDVVVWEGMEDS